jgi:hypothetical protein
LPWSVLICCFSRMCVVMSRYKQKPGFLRKPGSLSRNFVFA